jgi:hypothetical protein
MTPAVRPWCAIAQYPGLQRFLVGTVMLPANARHDEINDALTTHALTILPPGFSIIEQRCGDLIFQEDDP